MRLLGHEETNFVAAIASACQRPVRPLSAVGVTKQSGHDAWSRVFHTVPPRRPSPPLGKPDAMDVTEALGLIHPIAIATECRWRIVYHQRGGLRRANGVQRGVMATCSRSPGHSACGQPR
jgi:hypothetical protein